MTTTLAPRIAHDADGLNTEGDASVVASTFVTPVDQFYTRSHAVPPPIDLATWRLHVDGLVDSPVSMSFDELQRFPMREVTATLLCAGLRRNELLQVAPLPGELPWGTGPAATARWTGVPLRDVLEAAGVHPTARHIGFTGLDAVQRKGRTFGFGGSIDRAKALDPDVLLAVAQNGEPLRPEHGFPVRMIVPGWIGARSVKWLGHITALAEPSDNYFQTHAYRIQRDVDPANPTDVTKGVPLSAMNLNAVMLEPHDGASVATGPLTVRGWAVGAEGAAITSVEISTDDGATWESAELDVERTRWSWTRWQASVQLPTGTHTIVVRAHDATGVPQPAQLHDVWNAKGYMNNSWHRVRVHVS